jgi:hypothetical protein
MPGPTKALGRACQSLARQLACRFRGRVFGGLMSLVFLLPVPAWAALTFTPWNLYSDNFLTITPQADSTGANISFPTFTSGTGPFTVEGTSNVDASGSTTLTATFKNWNAYTPAASGNVTFEVWYNGTPLFPVTSGQTGQEFTFPFSNNQIVGSTGTVTGSNTIKFQVHFETGSSWGVPSSPPSIAFSGN